MAKQLRKTRWVAHDDDLERAARVAEAGGIVGLPKIGQSTEKSLTSLWQELDSARMWFEVGKRFRRSQQLGVLTELKEIARVSVRLGVLLREHDVFLFARPRPDLLNLPPIDADLAQAVLKVVAGLAMEGRARLDRDHPLAKGLGLHRWSAFDHLVGRLANIFENYSDQTVKFKRTMVKGHKKPLAGRFVSFSLKVCEEFGIANRSGKAYSPESVGRAYSHVRAGKPRSAKSKKLIGFAGR